MTNFFTPVQDGIHQVESLMLEQAKGNHPDLGAALDHLLSSGGKRIRPAITLLIGQMFGGDQDRLITLAAAIEMLHTATLVHDDLIDGSLLRRGIPTLNARWSPGATVLTGDFLFSRAAKMAADTNSVEVMKIFAQTLTTIVNGEITQLFSSRCQVNRKEYYQKIYAKTASLFETSSMSASIIADENPEVVENMREFGYNIGMAFQIVDDILDFTGAQATIGKPVGSDLRQGLVTLPTIYYAETHPDEADLRTLFNGQCEDNYEAISRLVETIRKSDAIERSHQEACKYIDIGLSKLYLQPATLHRDALEELANFIVKRDL